MSERYVFTPECALYNAMLNDADGPARVAARRAFGLPDAWVASPDHVSVRERVGDGHLAALLAEGYPVEGKEEAVL